MDSQINGQMDGWVDEQSRMNGQMDEQIDGQRVG